MNIELNLIIFIGFIILNNYNIYESPIKYYLINSFSSSLFIMLINLNLYYLNNLIDLIINLVILIKLGIFPFQYWFIDMLTNLNWINRIIIITWQKFIPFIVLLFVFNTDILIVIIFLGGFIRVFIGFNEINLKRIIGYSSINHICWIIFSLMVREVLWIIYYLSYMIINISLIYLFKILNLLNLLDMYKVKGIYNLILILIIISLGGLPPFFGFLIKWYGIYELVFSINFLVSLRLIFYSLIYLYNYIRICYSIIIINYLINKIRYNIILDYKIIFKNKLRMINIFIIFSIINLFLMIFWFFY